MKKAILQFNSGDLSANTISGKKHILSGVELEVYEAESLALTGKTGSGKSLSALEIMGLLPENIESENERVVFGGKKLSACERRLLLGKKIAYIPQNGAEYLSDTRTIGNQLADTLLALGTAKSEIKKESEHLLSLVGLLDEPKILSRYPFELSGGQNQRICIAMALAVKPLLLIADEPSNGLDEKSVEVFKRLLSTEFKESAKLIITHDANLAKECDREYRIVH